MIREIDVSTPEGIAQVRKYLKSVSASEALRLIGENERAAGAANFTRTAALPTSGIRTVDGEGNERAIDLTWSSEKPVERWFGFEVLSHDKSAVDLRWMQSGNAPLLYMHDSRQHIGAIESSSLDAEKRQCGSRARLAKDAEGERQLGRCKDGINRNTSVGYSIEEWERTDDPKDEDAPPTYRATRWTPLEASIVSVPADQTVGVGRMRSFRIPDTKTIPKVTLPTRTTMTPEEQAALDLKAANERKAAIAAERKRVNALNALRRKYDPTGTLVTDEDFARFADDEVGGENALRAFLMDKTATEERTAPGVTTTTMRQADDKLPLLHALRGLVFGDMPERYSAEDKKLRAASPMCFKPGSKDERQLVVNSDFVRSSRFLPVSEGFQRAQNAQQFGAGGALVGTTFAPEIIEYLRPQPVMVKAGAIVMSGITGGPGTIRFPKQTGDIYGQWAAAGIGSTPQQLPFGALDLTPKRLIAQIRIDKQLLLQESFDVEAYIRNSVNLQFALAYDLAGLIGSGNGMPLGILNTPNIQKGSITFNGPSASSGTLAPQYANFLTGRQLVLAANAGGLGKRTWITSPQSLINWAGVPKATPAATQTVNDKWMLEFGQGGMEYSVLGEMALETTYLNTLPTPYQAAGYALAVTDVAIYGPFNQYMFLEWAGVEWIYDPYTQAAEDVIVLTARLYVDGGCRQPTAFVTSSNAGSVQYV